MRRVVKTPFGSYTTAEVEGDDVRRPTGQEFLDLLWSVSTVKPLGGYNSLSERINGNILNINKIHAKEDASLEEIVSVFHSLIHKVTEGITNGEYSEARRAYKVLQEAIPKFNLPD